MIRLTTLTVVAALAATPSLATPGFTTSGGCHSDHCHNGWSLNETDKGRKYAPSSEYGSTRKKTRNNNRSSGPGFGCILFFWGC